MAAPNISLLGANYPSVPGITLPKQGGGTATFPWVEGSETKTENGTYDVTNLATHTSRTIPKQMGEHRLLRFLLSCVSVTQQRPLLRVRLVIMGSMDTP